MKKLEESSQVAFVGWFRVQYPQYRDLITIPSFGENVGPRRMKRLKQMGLTPGWPDIFIAVPRNFDMSWGETYNGCWLCCGLFIEMKTKIGKLQKNQLESHACLTKQGYRVEVCHSFEEAMKAAKEYLNG